MNPCEDTLARLRRAKEEMQTAGPVHRRDLYRHIRRLERALRAQDRLHPVRTLSAPYPHLDSAPNDDL